MAAIFYRLFDEGSKPYLTLAGDEFVRPLGIGSNWTNIKVAIVSALTPNGTSDITGLSFVMGLCTGTEQTIASSFCKNALAFYGASRTANYNAGPPPYYDYTPLITGAKIVNNVVTGASGSYTFTSGPTGVRHIMGFGILKGSPNYTVSAFCTSSAYMGIDHTLGHTFEALDQAILGATGTWVFNGVISGIAHTGSVVAFDESAGVLDTLDIYWSKVDFPLEIYGIYVARVA